MTLCVNLGEVLPWIFLDLLETKRDPSLLHVDIQDHHFDFVTLFEYFAGMHDPSGPGHIRDMNQTIDTLLYLDKSTKRGEVPYLSFEASTRWIFFSEGKPWIGLDLFHSERDLFRFRVHIQDHSLNDIADSQDLRWVPDMTGPGHFRHVHETLHPFFEFDECPVIGQADDFSPDFFANRVFFFDILPRIGMELLQTKRNSTPFDVYIKNFYLQFIADGSQF